MRHGFAVLVLASVVLIATVPAFADGVGVTYISGTLKSVAENANATLDMTSPAALQLQAGQTEIAIPYSAITTYDYKEENRFRLGVLATVGVSLLKARSKRHTVTIGWKDDAGAAQTATFETTQDRAQGLLKVLQARAPQACTGGLPWRRNHG